MFLDRLIIFTRHPEPGKTKTRLIPVLGIQGAVGLHRQMIDHTLTWARQLKNSSGVSLEVRYEGGDERRVRKWLGPDIPCCPQVNGDLGARMSQAFNEAFSAGIGRVIIVGTDIPGLSGGLVQTACEALKENDVVLGPAKDGGYYLIGLRKPMPQLFGGIPWGTGEVLPKTLGIAADLKLQVFLLEPLDDVDRPEDLGIWEKCAPTPSLPSPLEGEGKGGRDLPLISIIIPTLNEEENIAECLASTQNGSNVERIVVDGGSRDRTVEIALACGARVITSPAGRARQMNAGAKAASGDQLIFLHADTRLPEKFDGCIREILARPGIAAGAFEFRLDMSSRGLQIIERVANWRSRRLQMPYGDQAIFIRSALFRDIGGFPDMPIMEDFEFIRRLQKRGYIHTAPHPAITSARRWTMLGLWKTTLINELVVVAYYLGISPTRIRHWARRKM
jgi:rSAM/selenodomain-associated transferase 2/rSAM/selenodomain-associated transferase 1